MAIALEKLEEKDQARQYPVSTSHLDGSIIWKGPGGTSPGGKGSGSDVTCYKCNESGHIACNCAITAIADQRRATSGGKRGTSHETAGQEQ